VRRTDTMKLADNIYFYEGDYIRKTKRLYQGIGSSNFLVLSGRENAMIDSGMTDGPHKRRIISELESDGIDLGNTTNFIFSHSHPDHTRHAKALCREKKVKFLMHHDNEPFLSSDSSHFYYYYNYPKPVLKDIFGIPIWMAQLLLKYHLGFDYLRIDGYFSDYDILNYNADFQIIPLPSHSRGHVGFYFKEHKIFYSSDLFDFRVADGGIINNAQSSYMHVFSDIERVRALDIEIMIPGHGRIIQGKDAVKQVLDIVYRSTENYSKQILHHLKEYKGGLSVSKLTKLIYGKSIMYNLSSRRIIIYNCLEYLKTQGKTRMVLSRKTPRWFIV
jgi:glyoxylase-like metal-dependent hydrolase (beta-lactamase superfamily II)